MFPFHKNSCENRYTFYRVAIDFLLKILTFIETSFQYTSFINWPPVLNFHIPSYQLRRKIVLNAFMERIWIDKYKFIYWFLWTVTHGLGHNSHSFFIKIFNVHAVMNHDTFQLTPTLILSSSYTHHLMIYENQAHK